ncbi:MAG TPA: hypothetical protein VKS82_22850 [Streptosporangiaceae bacterium]|nr:hypothetical protein [Streptosporangiaceae bacterium]
MDDLYEIACCLQAWAGQRLAAPADQSPGPHDLHEAGEPLLRPEEVIPYGKNRAVQPRAGPR